MLPITPEGTSFQPQSADRFAQKTGLRPVVIFLVFATGYLLSYLFRTATGLLATRLVDDFHLGPRDLGLMTSLYFAAFAAFQIPAGLLIDRFGPRRVQTSLLLIASCGVFLFAAAQDRTVLMLSRALIGLGCSGALVTGIKALSLWLPRARRALGNCLLVACGSLGAIASTAPLDTVVDLCGWRLTFVALGATTLAVALLVWALVPEHAPGGAPGGAAAGSPRAVMGGLAAVFRDRRFWRVAPLSSAMIGGAFAIHGLWAARWLADVARMPESGIAGVMLAMGVGLGLGALGLGGLASRLRRAGIPTSTVFAAAGVTFVAVQAGIIGGAGVPAVLGFGGFAAFGAVTVLSFTMMGEFYPAEMAGRANGALNVLHLGAAFIMQAGIGAVVALWPADTAGHAPAIAYDWAFSMVMAVQVAALAWFAAAGGPRRAEIPAMV